MALTPEQMQAWSRGLTPTGENVTLGDLSRIEGSNEPGVQMASYYGRNPQGTANYDYSGNLQGLQGQNVQALRPGVGAIDPSLVYWDDTLGQYLTPSANVFNEGGGVAWEAIAMGLAPWLIPLMGGAAGAETAGMGGGTTSAGAGAGTTGGALTGAEMGTTTPLTSTGLAEGAAAPTGTSLSAEGGALGTGAGGASSSMIPGAAGMTQTQAAAYQGLISSGVPADTAYAAVMSGGTAGTSTGILGSLGNMVSGLTTAQILGGAQIVSGLLGGGDTAGSGGLGGGGAGSQSAYSAPVFKPSNVQYQNTSFPQDVDWTKYGRTGGTPSVNFYGNQPRSLSSVYKFASGGEVPGDIMPNKDWTEVTDFRGYTPAHDIGGFISYMLRGMKMPYEKDMNQEYREYLIRTGLVPPGKEGFKSMQATTQQPPKVTLDLRNITKYARGTEDADYAHGGEVYHSPGALNAVRHASGGQADEVDAKLSGGEYVIPSDIVSSIGDGNTDAGVKKLDNLLINVRRHKQSNSPRELPPKAKDIDKYLTRKNRIK